LKKIKKSISCANANQAELLRLHQPYGTIKKARLCIVPHLPNQFINITNIGFAEIKDFLPAQRRRVSNKAILAFQRPTPSFTKRQQ
jgi:hypothetical protein